MIVDCAVYENGARAKESLDLDHALDTARARGGFVWIGLHEPTADEFATVAEAFDLHPLAVEDAIHAHQRPKLERYGDSSFMAFKPSVEEVVEVGQIMVFLGADFVVTVRHGPSALTDVRRVLEEDPDRLQWGPASVLYFSDVHDHVMRVSEHLAGLDALLDSALNANVAQVGMRQNEDMRKITAWVANSWRKSQGQVGDDLVPLSALALTEKRESFEEELRAGRRDWHQPRSEGEQ